MASGNVYTLALTAWHRFMVFAMMVLFSVAGVVMIVAVLWGVEQRPPVPFVILWCAALAWNWYVLLGVPYEIRFDTPDRLSFIALGKSFTLSAIDIRSIKPYGGGGGFYVLRHEGGKIRLLAQFTGFHEVVSRIKTVNPAVEVVGI